MNVKKPKPKKLDCGDFSLIAIKDTVELLSGKWKIQIVGVLLLNDRRRFMDLLREVEGIGAKMLSKELHQLEQNRLVTRTVLDTKPVTVEYELTRHGKTLKTVIREIATWGAAHRKLLFSS